jgi:type VI protein secretion system component Hcp
MNRIITLSVALLALLAGGNAHADDTNTQTIQLLPSDPSSSSIAEGALSQSFSCDTGSICTVNTASKVSTTLLLRATEGSVYSFACEPIITLSTSGAKPLPLMTYKLTNTLVSSYSISSDDEGAPIESIRFNFAPINISMPDYGTSVECSPAGSDDAGTKPSTTLTLTLTGASDTASAVDDIKR